MTRATMATTAMFHPRFLLLLSSCLFMSVPVAHSWTLGMPSSSSSTTAAAMLPRVSAGPTLDISAMGCGTWSWGNRLLWDYDESQDEDFYASYKLLRDAGVTLFDTADSYGTLDLNGRAELLLGAFERRYLQECAVDATATTRPFWDLSKLSNSIASGSSRTSPLKQQVATKFAPYPWRLTRKSIVSAAESSLKRLNSKDAANTQQGQEICIAQLHWSTRNYLPAQESVLWKGIADTYDAGLCQAVGVSNYGPQQLQRVASFMKGERNVPLAIAQVQFSLMTFADPQARDMLDLCRDLDCRLVSYSPLCLGLLTGKYTLDRLPKSPVRQQLFRELLPGARDLLSALDAVAAERGSTCSQIALQWTLAKQTVPIPGARNVQMARDNVGAALARPLSPPEVDELDRAATRVSRPMINNIFQTK